MKLTEYNFFIDFERARLYIKSDKPELIQKQILEDQDKAEKWNSLLSIPPDYSDDKKFYILEQIINQLKQKIEDKP